MTCSWSGAKLKRQGPGPCCRPLPSALLPRPGSCSDAPWKGSVPLRAQGPWGRVVRPRWGLASPLPCESPCAQSPLSLRDQCFRLLATTIRVNRERAARPLVPRAPESVPPLLSVTRSHGHQPQKKPQTSLGAFEENVQVVSWCWCNSKVRIDPNDRDIRLNLPKAAVPKPDLTRNNQAVSPTPPRDRVSNNGPAAASPVSLLSPPLGEVWHPVKGFCPIVQAQRDHPGQCCLFCTLGAYIF